MTVNIVRNGSLLNVTVAGRLDTTTASEFEQALTSKLDDAYTIVVDSSDLQYISSAGLRVLLSAKKKIGDNEVIIKNANDEIKEILDITGFVDILKVE